MKRVLVYVAVMSFLHSVGSVRAAVPGAGVSWNHPFLPKWMTRCDFVCGGVGTVYGAGTASASCSSLVCEGFENDETGFIQCQRGVKARLATSLGSQYYPRTMDDCTPEARMAVFDCCDEAKFSQYECACYALSQLELGLGGGMNVSEEMCAGSTVDVVLPPSFAQLFDDEGESDSDADMYGWHCEEGEVCTHDAWSDLPEPGAPKTSNNYKWNLVPIRQLQVLNWTHVVGASSEPWPEIKNVCVEPYDPSTEYVAPAPGIRGAQSVSRLFAAGLGVSGASSKIEQSMVTVLRPSNVFPLFERVTPAQAISARESELQAWRSGLSGMTPTSTRLASTRRLAFEDMARQVIDEKREWDEDASFGSCEEYAYERFYNYNRFKDFSAAHQEDYRTVFEVAVGQCPAAGRTKASSVANKWDKLRAMQICGLDLKVAKGQPAVTTGSAAMPGVTVTTPKNVFFETTVAPYNASLGGLSVPSIGARAKYLACVRLSGAQRTSCLESYAPEIAMLLRKGPVIEDDKLMAAIKDAQDWGAKSENRVLKDWSWHVRHSDGLAAAGIQDEQLYAYDDLKKELQRLMAQRTEVAMSLTGNLGIFDVPVVVDNNPLARLLWPILERISRLILVMDTILPWLGVDKVIYDDLISWSVRQGYPVAFVKALADRSMLRLQVKYGLDTTRYRTALSSAFSQWKLANPQAQEAVFRVGQLEVDVVDVDQGGLDAIIDEAVPKGVTKHLSKQVFDTIEALPIVLQIRGIDQRIEAVMNKAMRLGCFAKTKALNPCDWSPRLFVETLSLDMEKDVQAAEDKCVKLTKGYGADFERYGSQAVKDTTVACGKSLNDIASTSSLRFSNWPSRLKSGLDVWAWLAESSHSFENRFEQVTQPACQLAAEMVFQKAREAREAGEPETDRDDMGNDIVSLYYDYGFDYGIKNLEQYTSGAAIGEDDVSGQPELEPMRAYANGSFRTGVNLLGKDFDIINVEAGIQLPREKENSTILMVTSGNNIEFFSRGYALSSGEQGTAETNEDGKEFSGTLFEVK